MTLAEARRTLLTIAEKDAEQITVAEAREFISTGYAAALLVNVGATDPYHPAVSLSDMVLASASLHRIRWLMFNRITPPDNTHPDDIERLYLDVELNIRNRALHHVKRAIDNQDDE